MSKRLITRKRHRIGMAQINCDSMRSARRMEKNTTYLVYAEDELNEEMAGDWLQMTGWTE